jgi:NADH:ubiquinone oxidoreductase subunit E
MDECANASANLELSQELERIIAPYRGEPTGLIQVLAKAQKRIGYLPKWVQKKVADGKGITLAPQALYIYYLSPIWGTPASGVSIKRHITGR